MGYFFSVSHGITIVHQFIFSVKGDGFGLVSSVISSKAYFTAVDEVSHLDHAIVVSPEKKTQRHYSISLLIKGIR